MGNPRIYYYPDVDGSLEYIDLGEGLSDIQEGPSATVEDAETADGYPYRSFLGAAFSVRVVLERFGSAGTSSLERKFQTLQAHLAKGGFIGFSRDHAKTWAGITSAVPERGDLTLHISGAGSGFGGWSSSGTVATGDEMVLETAPPDALREFFIASTITASPASDIPVPSPGCVYTYGAQGVVRWRDFYPVLWLPPDGVKRPIVTHDHRRNFTFDATFAYSPRAVLQLWESDTQYGSRGSSLSRPGNLGAGSLRMRDDTSKAGLGGASLEALLAGSRVPGAGTRLGRGRS